MGHGAGINAIVITPDGTRAISSSDDSTLKVWNLEGCCLCHDLRSHTGSVVSVALTPNGNQIISPHMIIHSGYGVSMLES